MALTRPTVAQLNTVITEISDPVSVLNKGSTLANIDVGFVINRDSGISSNAAIIWQESSDQFVLGFTSNSGAVFANIVFNEYANLRVNQLTGTLVTSAQPNITSVGNLISLAASGNISTTGYLFGNGSQLTGVITNVTKIIDGTSDITAYQNGNIAVTVGGTANTIVFTSSNIHVTGSIIPSANVTYDLGSSTNRFRSAYFAGSTIYIGNSAISESTLAAIVTFPTGDYGDLVTSTVDAFGVQSDTSFDLNAAGAITTIDLGVLT